jgi:D-alanyl-D-alanine carboxypeptidase
VIRNDGYLRTMVQRPLAAALGLIVAASMAACGTTAPTPPVSARPTATAVVQASPSATPGATPTLSGTPPLAIAPVPTSQFATPAPAAAGLDAAAEAALQKTLDSIRTSGGYPGVSAAIVYPDGSTWSGQSGMAIVSSKDAVTADTLFSVGSISKTFVAALAGRLAARGTISLDDPLSKYVPTFPNAANISLRQLLNHTSGIKDLFQNLSPAITARPSRVWTADQVLAGVGTPYFAPGKSYHYSNTNYVLLGLAIEQATGQPIASLIRSEFLAPLGLDHTFYQVTEQAQGPKAHGYMGSASAPVDQWPVQTMIPFTSEVTAVGPAGAYVSNATDLARWATALYGGDVLDQATLASMVDISPSAPFKPRYLYGLGFEEWSMAGLTAWGHRGNLDGFWSTMAYLPASHITIVILTNAQWADPIGAAASLAKTVLGPTS